MPSAFERDNEELLILLQYLESFKKLFELVWKRSHVDNKALHGIMKDSTKRLHKLLTFYTTFTIPNLSWSMFFGDTDHKDQYICTLTYLCQFLIQILWYINWNIYLYFAACSWRNFWVIFHAVYFITCIFKVLYEWIDIV